MAFLRLAVALFTVSTSAWTLKDTYDASNWQSMFTVFTGTNVNNEYVNYVDSSTAQSDQLIRTVGDALYVGVDNSTLLNYGTTTGRNSVRLTGNPSYQGGLFIADFAHMPGNACGVWPSYWLLGEGSWPQNGEIDVIEGVNMYADNQITIHSHTGCSPTVGSGGQSGQTASDSQTDCGDGGGADGCGVVDTNAGNYGNAFNAAGGGVYALLWSNSQITVWQWTAGNVPGDIASGAPNPSGWGTPVANWAGCAFNNFFSASQIIVDTTFCGDWAGNVWGDTPPAPDACASGVATCNCASLASSCDQYVAQNPAAFDEAYWLINSIKVYQ